MKNCSRNLFNAFELFLGHNQVHLRPTKVFYRGVFSGSSTKTRLLLNWIKKFNSIRKSFFVGLNIVRSKRLSKSYYFVFHPKSFLRGKNGTIRRLINIFTFSSPNGQRAPGLQSGDVWPLSSACLSIVYGDFVCSIQQIMRKIVSVMVQAALGAMAE